MKVVKLILGVIILMNLSIACESNTVSETDELHGIDRNEIKDSDV